MENCFFYISRMYEFLHSLGQKQTTGRRREVVDVRFAPESGQTADRPEMSA
jgi:hypothetical protein